VSGCGTLQWRWSYYESREAAYGAAPVDSVFSVVDVTNRVSTERSRLAAVESSPRSAARDCGREHTIPLPDMKCGCSSRRAQETGRYGARRAHPKDIHSRFFNFAAIESKQTPRGNSLMIECTYDAKTGAVVSERRTGSALPPGDMPAPDANRPVSGSFKDEWYGQWNPSDSPDDPHDTPYKEGTIGTVDGGPVPSNISDGNPPPGPFSSVAGHWSRPTDPAADPYDAA
jgi:hypothetical protein